MSHMQMKEKTNVLFSVHECVMETWHVQCSKNRKHTLFPFKADVATRTLGTGVSLQTGRCQVDYRQHSCSD